MRRILDTDVHHGLGRVGRAHPGHAVEREGAIEPQGVLPGGVGGLDDHGGGVDISHCLGITRLVDRCQEVLFRGEVCECVGFGC